MVARINELSDISLKLNKKSDQLNRIISSINGKLAKLNLGVEVWEHTPIIEGEIHTTDENWKPVDPYREVTLLGYCHLEREFQLAVKDLTVATTRDRFGDECEEMRDPIELKPLLKAPRDVRIRAMRLVPLLIERIKHDAGNLLSAIEAAEKVAEEDV